MPNLQRLTVSTILVAIFSLSFIGCSEKKVKKVIPPKDVTIVTIKKEPIPIWIDFVGKTQANKVVDVTARVSGRLEKILFNVGDTVKKGETLFVIQKDDYIAQVDRANAKLAQDKATLDMALKDVERYTPLVQKDLAPREKLDQLKARADEIRAMVSADEASVRTAKLDLSYCDVEARIDGTIGRNLIDVGNVVGTNSDNTKLAQVVNNDPMFVYFSPSNESLLRIFKYRTTDKMKVKVDQPNVSLSGESNQYEGYVDFVDNVTDKATGTVTMRATVSNHNKELYSGVFVDIHVFVTDKESVYSVDPVAINQNQLGSFVYTLDQNDTLKTTPVTLLFTNDKYAIITKGLKDNDRVVVSSSLGLKEGLKVAPKAKVSK
ncbi:MAG: efflux RND transporter periplasmic adaptor subunit [Helicobacteraceae bacterium]|nr:efflux RND transporter periplasmic adaptor subunit [Helicobacteraceae bacterium]